MNAQGFVPRLVLRWTALYTRGLESALRNDRRDEIASDVFEQWRVGEAGWSHSLAMLGRCLRGMPADVSWRIEHARSVGAPARALMGAIDRVERAARWVDRNGLPKLTPVVAVLYATLGVLLFTIAAAGNTDDPGGVVFVGTWSFVAGAAMVSGWRRMAAHPNQGLALVVGGVAPLSLLLVVTVVAPVAAVLVVWSEMRRWWALRRRAVS